MNSIILFCLGILYFVHAGQSAVAVLRDARDPAHPGKCVSKFAKDQIIINPGETITERTKCTRISCSLGYQMNFATCGKIAGYPPECQLSDVDQTKDYPDCCPKVVCAENTNTI